MNTHEKQRPDSGFSLIELIVATLIFGVIVSGALGFMTVQNRAFSRGTDQLNALQNLRYAYQLLEIDLSTLGNNVPEGQPSLVYGGDSVIAFSADHTSNRQNDFSAVFINTGFPNGWVIAPRNAVSLPGAGVSWPDTVYMNGPVRSPAELIVFFFVLDDNTARSDDYVLYRQVNDRDPEVVARGLLKLDDRPFFRYYQRKSFTSQVAQLDSISDSSIPLFHTAKEHGALDDTASSALADSVRAVRVNMRVTNGRPGEEERFSETSRIIPLPNAGFGVTGSCGDQPINNQTITAVLTMVDGVPTVELAWDKVVDEGGGENDVVRYVVFKVEGALVGGDWGEPFRSIPAGADDDTFSDSEVESGKTYRYTFAAQDCTPTLSGLANTATVIVP